MQHYPIADGIAPSDLLSDGKSGHDWQSSAGGTDHTAVE